MIEVWTEKYRPKKLIEIEGQSTITNRLRAFVKSQNFPHLLFAGPAGVGKTTAALAIARELFGEEWKDSFLELNASDSRGIDVVRNNIKEFSKTKSIHDDIPFKIIFLDEADALTKEAQDALRRIMEDYVRTVRFIMSCNYSSKIITPIQSRCAIFRFEPLQRDIVKGILVKIAEAEGFKINEDAFDLLYDASEGDMRKAENLLQACASTTKDITRDIVREVVSFAEPKEIELIVKTAIAGNFLQAKERLNDVIVRHGLSGLDVIKQIQKETWKLDIEEKHKLELTRLCGEFEFRMVEGSNEFIQLAALLAEFTKIKS
ncbi:MAG: replication factor C small subunit [Nanoarchaeota archaeon]